MRAGSADSETVRVRADAQMELTQPTSAVLVDDVTSGVVGLSFRVKLFRYSSNAYSMLQRTRFLIDRSDIGHVWLGLWNLLSESGFEADGTELRVCGQLAEER